MAHKSELIERDIDAYLLAHQHKSLLRFITCGSVDDLDQAVSPANAG